MCKKELKDAGIIHWFFIYLVTHLTVLGNYKVFQRNTESANRLRYIYIRYMYIHHHFHYS